MTDRTKIRRAWGIEKGIPLHCFNISTGKPKIAHATMLEAQLHVKELGLKTSRPYDIYTCLNCGFLHVGGRKARYSIPVIIRDEIGHRAFYHLALGDTEQVIAKRFESMERRR